MTAAGTGQTGIPSARRAGSVDSGAPLVSIGLPVRNGIPYIGEALAALCAQTHSNVEIVVRNNASTDDTAEVCRAAAARDPRIRVIDVQRNEGAAQNFNHVFAATTAEFFSWAAHDDRFLPEYIERCATALQADSTVAMCVPSIAFIDEDGCRTGVLVENPALRSDQLATRLRCFLHRDGWYTVYGVARREALAEAGLFGSSWGPDVVLLWRILLVGPIAVLPDVLLEYRRYSTKTVAGVWEGLVPDDGSGHPSFLHVRMFRVMWRYATIMQEPSARGVARLALLRWLPSVFWRNVLFADLKVEYLRARDRRQIVRALSFLAAMALIRPGRAFPHANSSRTGAVGDASRWSPRASDGARHRAG